MMDDRKHEDWIDVLREAATAGSDEKLPEGLWNRISSGLDAPKPRPARRRIYVWGASVAAAAVVAAFGIFMMKTSVSDIQGEVAEAPVISAMTEQQAETACSEFAEAEPAGDIAAYAAPVNRRVVKKTEGADSVDVQSEPHPIQDKNEEPAPVQGSAGDSKGDEDPGNKDSDKDKDRHGAHTSQSGGLAMFPDPIPANKPSARKGMLAVSTNGFASVSSNTPGGNPTQASAAMLAPNREGLMVMSSPPEQYSFRHRQPLTFAFSLDFNIGHNLFAGAGVSYTRLSSRVSAIESHREFNQLIQYVGIPVSFKWAYLNTNYFMLYAGIEAQAEFCVGARFDGRKADARTMQWSAHAVAGAQVNLGKHIGIYVEPKLSHYFIDTGLETIRNTKGVNFNLQLGLRFSY